MRGPQCLYTELPATDHQLERHLYLPPRGHVRLFKTATEIVLRPPTNLCSYFVTELLGTDLHRLLTSRPLEKQFIQYFLYQILVCELDNRAKTVHFY